MQLIRTHAIQRRDPATQHVVSAAVAAGALDRAHVRRLLDHAEQGGIPARIATDGAWVLFGEVAAHPARGHLAADSPERLRQPLRRLGGLLQQVKREPLRRFPPDAGELGKLRHELLDGRHGALEWRQL